MTARSRDERTDGDRDLLAEAQLGSERAFGRLAEHHTGGLEIYCELMLGCPDRGHEAVLETLLRAWCELDSVDAHVSARMWLYGLATGVCLEDRDWTD